MRSLKNKTRTKSTAISLKALPPAMRSPQAGRGSLLYVRHGWPCDGCPLPLGVAGNAERQQALWHSQPRTDCGFRFGLGHRDRSVERVVMVAPHDPTPWGFAMLRPGTMLGCLPQ